MLRFAPRASILNSAGSFMLKRSKYHLAHATSIKESSKFWDQAAKEIDWIKPYSHVSQHSAVKDHNNWFVGGKLNTSENCLDRHVAAGLGDKTAIIYDSPVTNTIRKISYNELLEEVIKSASLLKNLGVVKGKFNLDFLLLQLVTFYLSSQGIEL